MTVALSIAIFATTYENDKSLKWKLWFYGRLADRSLGSRNGNPVGGQPLWVVAGSLDFVKIPMDRLHYAVSAPVGE